MIVGMTGSGKTGLVTVLVEEALRAGIPTLAIDVKGDLPNLLLSFPGFDPADLAAWVDGDTSPESIARINDERKEALADWNIGPQELASYSATTSVRVITPGDSSGEPLHVLSGLERRSARWDTDPEGARSAMTAAVSLVLRLLGRDPDPAKSKEHVLLSVLAERRLAAGQNADLPGLMADLENPPIDSIGTLSIESFLKKAERRKLAAALNGLLASPSFASWRKGISLDVGEWLKPANGRTPAVVLSVAHLDDEERALVLGVVLEEVLCWVRSLSGTQRLRALVVFDEVYGFLPPHPANPPTKRLQTDADRERVIDGLQQADAGSAGEADLDGVVQRLSPRWFVVRDAQSSSAPLLMQPRYAMSFLRGPMTRAEIRKGREWCPDPPTLNPQK